MSVSTVSAHDQVFSMLPNRLYLPESGPSGSRSDMPERSPRYTSPTTSLGVLRICQGLTEVLVCFLGRPDI